MYCIKMLAVNFCWVRLEWLGLVVAVLADTEIPLLVTANGM
ncbi:MAG: hypothetical protein CLLPBCKN_007335 [Chroococcidiopsis cubana SAG 39.79]|nr:hypothetical protein [Chroococcidiopsis cubana]MDZ4877900.1 hypothetical protein [Chroococcidiopsis cubana SAG 39.79]